MRALDLLEYCRFCGDKKKAAELIDMSKHKDVFGDVYVKLHFINADYVCLNDDSLPKTICRYCYQTLDRTHSFLTNVKKVQETLRLIKIKLKTENAVNLTSRPGTPDSPVLIIDESPNEEQQLNSGIVAKILPQIDLTNTATLKRKTGKKTTKPVGKKPTELKYEKNPTCWSKYNWLCYYCDEMLPNASMLAEHCTKTHDQCVAYRCSDCKQEHTDYNVFIYHVQKHHGSLRLRCEYCNLRFENSKCLNQHRVEHQILQKCQLCLKSFPSEQKLFEHKKTGNDCTKDSAIIDIANLEKQPTTSILATSVRNSNSLLKQPVIRDAPIVDICDNTTTQTVISLDTTSVHTSSNLKKQHLIDTASAIHSRIEKKVESNISLNCPIADEMQFKSSEDQAIYFELPVGQVNCTEIFENQVLNIKQDNQFSLEPSEDKPNQPGPSTPLCETRIPSVISPKTKSLVFVTDTFSISPETLDTLVQSSTGNLNFRIKYLRQKLSPALASLLTQAASSPGKPSTELKALLLKNKQIPQVLNVGNMVECMQKIDVRKKSPGCRVGIVVLDEVTGVSSDEIKAIYRVKKCSRQSECEPKSKPLFNSKSLLKTSPNNQVLLTHSESLNKTPLAPEKKQEIDKVATVPLDESIAPDGKKNLSTDKNDAKILYLSQGDTFKKLTEAHKRKQNTSPDVSVKKIRLNLKNIPSPEEVKKVSKEMPRFPTNSMQSNATASTHETQTASSALQVPFTGIPTNGERNANILVDLASQFIQIPMSSLAPVNRATLTSIFPNELNGQNESLTYLKVPLANVPVHLRPKFKEMLGLKEVPADGAIETQEALQIRELQAICARESRPKVPLLQRKAVDKSWKGYRWACSLCDKQIFESAHDLREHSKIVHAKCFTMKCVDCGEVEKSFRSFVTHVILHRRFLQQYCPYCNYCIVDKSLREKHIRTHKFWLCRKCGALMDSAESLAHHTSLYAPNQWVNGKKKTEQKRKDYAKTDEIGANTKNTEQRGKDDTKTNAIGAKTKKKGQKQKDHAKTNEIGANTKNTEQTQKDNTKTNEIGAKTPYQCGRCLLYFKYFRLLNEHVATHKEIEYICDYCKAPYADKSTLEKHLSGPCTNSCRYCHEVFTDNRECSRHEHDQHTHSKILFSCEFCTRVYSSVPPYEKHLQLRHQKLIDRNEKERQKKKTSALGKVQPSTFQL